MQGRLRFAIGCGLIAGLVVGSVGCASPARSLVVGMPRADVERALGMPNARHALPVGERLEFATGPYGRTTWMVDLNAAGKLESARQVLDERHLLEVQARLPGMTRDALLRTLGRPGEVRGGGWQGGQVWSWRYETHWCLWFQVSIGDDGRVRDGAFLPDPVCDHDDDRSARS